MMRTAVFSPNVHRSEPTMLLQTSTPRRIALGAVIVGIACLLAGCSAAAPAAPAATQTRQGGGSFGQNGVPGGGGVFGQIAAVNGNTLQVQSQSAQTAVDVSASTIILQTSTASATDVTVGSCIVASAFPAAGSSASPSSSGAVTSVAISPATNGNCAGGLRVGPRNGTRPTASPRPSAPRNRTFTPPVAGLVTGVSGSTITVSVKSAAGATSTKDVTTTSSTAYTLTSSATSAALTVGRCAAVRGATDSAGAVTATSVTVSDPGANGCTAGFGRRGGTGGVPSSPQSGSSGGNA